MLSSHGQGRATLPVAYQKEKKTVVGGTSTRTIIVHLRASRTYPGQLALQCIALPCTVQASSSFFSIPTVTSTVSCKSCGSAIRYCRFSYIPISKVLHAKMSRRIHPRESRDEVQTKQNPLRGVVSLGIHDRRRVAWLEASMLCLLLLSGVVCLVFSQTGRGATAMMPYCQSVRSQRHFSFS